MKLWKELKSQKLQRSRGGKLTAVTHLLIFLLHLALHRTLRTSFLHTTNVSEFIIVQVALQTM